MLGENSQLDLKQILHEKTYLKLLLGILFFVYCYLSILPKHWDFYTLSTAAQIVAKGHINFYDVLLKENSAIISGLHPPLSTLIEGFWIKLGLLLHIYSLDNLHNIDNFPTDGRYLNPLIQFWLMLPCLLALLACAIASYYTLKNKWLSILWFGSFTFISVNVMGQDDIFASFFILISAIILIKSFYSEKYASYIYLSLASLGISTLVKTYGFLLFPLYVLIAIKLISQHTENKKSKIKIYSRLLVLVIFILISPMLTYGKWINAMVSGESSWAFNLRTFGVDPFNSISIWLLGYCIIIYILYKNLININFPKEYTKVFIYFSILDLSWFFISVHSFSQWWVILVPFIIEVLDNFESVLNYLFASLIYILFLFYPMRNPGTIKFLTNYIWVAPIDGKILLILLTLMVATLVIWMIELQKEVEKNFEEIKISSENNSFRNKLIPILIIILPFVVNNLLPRLINMINVIR
jgi:hypothetical protein